jgi:FKBP-type peptidyl-prolyl cis-trans isomerase
MSVGERCNLTIQPEWAYGQGGAGADIPPNSVLVFDVFATELDGTLCYTVIIDHAIIKCLGKILLWSELMWNCR